MLHGPDPDMFRTKVYSARWYCDPLPTDDIAAATQDRWPAVSTIKKAWSKPFRKKLPTGEVVPLDAFRAAEFAVDRLPAINALDGDRDAAITLIATAAGRFLNHAANRGSGVHTVLEDLGAGKPIEEVWLDAAVLPFLPACRSFIADWQPLWVATEFIAFNRELGYGGTADAIVTIQHNGAPWTALVDWKTRGGDHGAYEEEIAQIGGYSLAEYIVVTSPIDGRPIRMPLPALDGGLVVSLTKDSYQLFPVDLDEAQNAFRAMHVSWQQNREGQSAARRGRLNPLIAASTTQNQAEARPGCTCGLIGATAADDEQHLTVCALRSQPAGNDRVAWLKDRIAAISDAGHLEELAVTWPPDTPTLKAAREQQLTPTDLYIDAIAVACALVEKTHELSFPQPDPLFAGFDQKPAALEHAATAARAQQPTAQEWAARARALLAPLEDEVTQQAVAQAAGAVGQKMTRRLHDNIAALVAELIDPNGTVSLEIGADGTQSIAVTADARDRMAAAHDGNEIAALAAAKSHAKALGLPAPRSLAKAAESPLLAALVAAGQQQ